ncbi:MAG: hypothetical protein HQM09_14190 [Candidatus Riflebacteria bacterium]|nr:hypothetical protein [Candidatus Riflebacteria bacterium]
MNKKSFAAVLFIVAFCLTVMVVARADNSSDTQAAPASASTEPMQMPAGASGFSGTVVETMNSGGYTYVFVDDGTTKQWAAAPECKVKVGDKVKIPEGAAMPGFHSKTLNRDFAMIFFVPSIIPENASGAATTTMPTATASDACQSCNTSGTGNTCDTCSPVSAKGSSSALLTATSTMLPGHSTFSHSAAIASGGQDVPVTGIVKAEGGKTVEEIYAEKTALSGKEVKVRGKVVKYNSGILGKNWFHIKDGSGKTGSDDLTVTTSATVKVGDTVIVTGPLSVDKDFGHGYTYAVIVEDAKVVTE